MKTLHCRRSDSSNGAFVFAFLVLFPTLMTLSRAHAQQSVLKSGFGGPIGFGERDNGTDPVDISAAFPSGLRLGDRVSDTVYLNLTAVLSLGGRSCCYRGEALPHHRDLPDVVGRIHVLEVSAATGSIDPLSDDWPVYRSLIPAGPDGTGGRLIATWHRLPDRSLGIAGARYTSAQLILEPGPQPGDFDVEMRYHGCEWADSPENGSQYPVIGFDADAGPRGRAWEWPGSRTAATERLCELSNVDEAGVFRFEVRRGIPTGCGTGHSPEPLGPGSCDDGNARGVDGCSSACRPEPDVDSDGWPEEPFPGAVDPFAEYDSCLDEHCADDGDGEPPHSDNCPDDSNPDQLDYNEDGVGDRCDPDIDGDGFFNEAPPDWPAFDPDLCPSLYSRPPLGMRQIDTDGDGIGDPCDPDDDGDGVLDQLPWWPTIPTDNAYDDDRDTRIDEAGECEAGDRGLDPECVRGDRDLFDNDLDGRLDEADEGELPRVIVSSSGPEQGLRDNCRTIPNRDQADLDGDGLGDACDQDVDGDGIRDEDGDGERADNCPWVANADQRDSDGDGAGDPCDDDDDGDGHVDGDDNCPDAYNPGQWDANGDGVGRACDPFDDHVVIEPHPCADGITAPRGVGVPGAPACRPPAPTLADTDQDGIADTVDNCPRVLNVAQHDIDGDGVGDLCDPDRDGDGIGDDVDRCPDDPDPLQLDADEDGIGDRCDPSSWCRVPAGVSVTDADRLRTCQGGAAHCRTSPAAGSGGAGLGIGLILIGLMGRRRRARARRGERTP